MCCLSRKGPAPCDRGRGCLPSITASETSRSEGGQRTGPACVRQIDHRPPPSAGHGFQLPQLTMGTGFVKSRRGVEKPKGKKQLEIVARGRSSRGALQGRIVSIFAAMTPQGRLQNARGGVSPAVFSNT